MSFAFRVPGDPFAFKRAGRNGKFSFTPKVQANYMNLVKLMASQAMKKAKQQVFEGPLHVTVSVNYRWPKSLKQKYDKGKLTHKWKTSRPDLDNLSKIVFDAVNGIVWLDDAQVVSSSNLKMFTDGEGFTDIQVSEM